VSPSGSIATSTPTYRWNAVPTATYYYLWVNATNGSPRIQVWYTAAAAGCAGGTGTCAITPGTALASGAATWWIQTWSAAGFGPWSSGLAFSVQ
jgi:hypothetical protein